MERDSRGGEGGVWLMLGGRELEDKLAVSQVEHAQHDLLTDTILFFNNRCLSAEVYTGYTPGGGIGVVDVKGGGEYTENFRQVDHAPQDLLTIPFCTEQVLLKKTFLF